jgi:hypothetical protein
MEEPNPGLAGIDIEATVKDILAVRVSSYTPDRQNSHLNTIFGDLSWVQYAAGEEDILGCCKPNEDSYALVSTLALLVGDHSS